MCTGGAFAPLGLSISPNTKEKLLTSFCTQLRILNFMTITQELEINVTHKAKINSSHHVSEKNSEFCC